MGPWSDAAFFGVCLGLHCLPITRLAVRENSWVKRKFTLPDQTVHQKNISGFQFLTESVLLRYSWLSLSRPRLCRITAYLEVKILFLLKHENLTKGKKYCGNIVEKEKLLQFSSFPQYFQYTCISNLRVQLHIYLLNVVVQIIFFLSSANLICRGTDIS